jgi:hypothetical protein
MPVCYRNVSIMFQNGDELKQAETTTKGAYCVNTGCVSKMPCSLFTHSERSEESFRANRRVIPSEAPVIPSESPGHSERSEESPSSIVTILKKSPLSPLHFFCSFHTLVYSYMKAPGYIITVREMCIDE